ncbi:MAG: hypothetical protein RJB38_880 [Pseudomonadota bacterium]|jgi:acyl-CoA thioesterase-1
MPLIVLASPVPRSSLLVRTLGILFFLLAWGTSSRAQDQRSQSSVSVPQKIKIIALGDSLTEGYGVALQDAYPAILERLLHQRFARDLKIEVQNAGIGGSTSASGAARLRWHLRAKPDLLLLALGANDMLRGAAPASTEANLRKTLMIAKENHLPVILAGMRVPPNYGTEYRRRFEAIYPKLAREFKIELIPFLLEGVAGNPELNLQDGIHPNEAGQMQIAKKLAPRIEAFLTTQMKLKLNPGEKPAPSAKQKGVS